MKNTYMNIYHHIKDNLSRHQLEAIEFFAILLVVDVVYTSIGFLSGRFVELNPVLNEFPLGNTWLVGFILFSHVLFFIVVLFFVYMIINITSKKEVRSRYDRFVISMVCYIPSFIMIFVMWSIVCLNVFSMGWG